MAHPWVVARIKRRLGTSEPVAQATETELLGTEELQGEETQEEEEKVSSAEEPQGEKALKTPTGFPNLPPLPQNPPAQLLTKRTSRTSITDSKDSSSEEAPTSPKAAPTSSSLKSSLKLTRQARFDAVTVGGTRIVPADVTFGSILKDSNDLESPVTCTVKIGQKTFVLKARSVDVIDNVINTKLLRALSISGVEAPDIEVLTPGLCTPLAQKFQTDAPNLVQALQSDIPSQLAEQAPGVTLASLEENAKKWDLLADLKAKDMLDPAKVTRDLANKMPKPKKLVADPTGIKSKTWDETVKTLTSVGTLLGPKFGSQPHRDAIAQLNLLKTGEIHADFISQIGTDQNSARALLLAKQAGHQAHGQLVSWLKSNAGIGAIAGLAVADLVFGMGDRILPTWAGANFTFDGKDLWAIDNAKNTTKGYNDPVKGLQKIATTTLTDDSNDEWKTQLGRVGVKTGDDVAGSVFSYVYVKSKYYGLSGADPATTLAVIKPVVDKTLQTLVGLSKSDQFPQQVQQNLKARLQYLGVIQ